MGTTIIAVVLGIILVVSINPGDQLITKSGEEKRKVRAIDSLFDLIRNMFPENLIQACFAQLTTGVKTIQVDVEKHIVNMTSLSLNQSNVLKELHDLKTEVTNGSNITYYMTSRDVDIAGAKSYGGSSNVLGLVVFSLAVGLILGRMGEEARPFVRWVSILNDVVMELVTLVMWYSPIGIWSLISAKFALMEDISGTFASLGLYMTTVILGLIIHSFTLLPLVFFFFTRRNP